MQPYYFPDINYGQLLNAVDIICDLQQHDLHQIIYKCLTP